MKNYSRLFVLFTFSWLVAIDASATEPFINAANLEVVSASATTLAEDGETSTLAEGDLLSREDLAKLAFAADGELRLRDPATGQIYILNSAADALALRPLWTPPLSRGSTQTTFAGNNGQQTEEPNPRPQPRPLGGPGSSGGGGGGGGGGVVIPVYNG